MMKGREDEPSMASDDVAEQRSYYISQHSPQLRKEIQHLQKELQMNQSICSQLEEEMDLKFKKYKDEMELGKQRENKLMFFLYVLKEEKKAPVTDVFE